ncbi:MAG: hypothetical protein U1F11_02720 [Steroidobacteraceae bacterium]
MASRFIKVTRAAVWTILMVHGSQSTLKTWDYIALLLARHYRVIRYDILPPCQQGPTRPRRACWSTSPRACSSSSA